MRGEVLNGSEVSALPRRDRLVVSTCLVLVVGLAWAYLLHLDRQMSSHMAYTTAMASMAMPAESTWKAIDVFFTFEMWTVMMVGMMAGTAAPVLMLFRASAVGRTVGSGSLPVFMFALGYLAVWVGFSACAALAQWALHDASPWALPIAASRPNVGGVILVAAGAYQLAPIKGACLTQCRSPLGFLMTNWRDGNVGAFRMGFRHGMLCLGCCWALMCVLFVVGVMNLAWVATLAVVVFLEKIAPAGPLVARAVGVLMIIVGLMFVAGIR